MPVWVVNAIKWLITLFAPQIFAEAKTFLKKLIEKIVGYFKKEKLEKKEAELIEKEKNAKTKEEQENAAKDIIDHANGD